ncbi:hypothetical protein SEA_OUTIS_69 [Gordonia phage Outis]|nr:hypothetical protein SEA_STARSTRUCK_69 [Gordonia phage StarStruck]WKW85042.1 hypothetical protein SEA_OUTIS_69 [Gordonia phage Outis]
MTFHSGVDPAIVGYVHDEYGNVSQKSSTLVYEQGTEGMIRRFVGYVIEPLEPIGDMLTYLPVADPDNKATRFNYVGSRHVYVLRVNISRVISILEEVILP